MREAQYSWGALPQGAGETTCCLAPCGIECRGGCLEAWSRKMAKTTDQKKRANASTASHPKKSLRGVPRESKKRAGPRMAPRRNPRTKRMRGQNRVQKQKKKKSNNTCGGGVWCPVSPELYLFKEKWRKKRNNRKRRQPKP